MDAVDVVLAVVLVLVPWVPWMVRRERRVRVLARNASWLLSKGQKKPRPADGPNGNEES
jgi:hypothetical protein